LRVPYRDSRTSCAEDQAPNVRHLARLSGEETGAVEMIGKPNDSEEIVDAMRRALAQTGH
jgi:FixJ family two-component response regulator